jgi:hypothetical protein
MQARGRVLRTRLQPNDDEAFRAAEAQIAEFDAVDPGSDAFGFAHDTKGRPVKPALSEVDLANLRKVMATCITFWNVLTATFVTRKRWLRRNAATSYITTRAKRDRQTQGLSAKGRGRLRHGLLRRLEPARLTIESG